MASMEPMDIEAVMRPRIWPLGLWKSMSGSVNCGGIWRGVYALWFQASMASRPFMSEPS